MKSTGAWCLSLLLIPYAASASNGFVCSVVLNPPVPAQGMGDHGHVWIHTAKVEADCNKVLLWKSMALCSTSATHPSCPSAGEGRFTAAGLVAQYEAAVAAQAAGLWVSGTGCGSGNLYCATTVNYRMLPE